MNHGVYYTEWRRALATSCPVYAYRFVTHDSGELAGQLCITVSELITIPVASQSHVTRTPLSHCRSRKLFMVGWNYEPLMYLSRLVWCALYSLASRRAVLSLQCALLAVISGQPKASSSASWCDCSPPSNSVDGYMRRLLIGPWRSAAVDRRESLGQRPIGLHSAFAQRTPTPLWPVWKWFYRKGETSAGVKCCTVVREISFRPTLFTKDEWRRRSRNKVTVNSDVRENIIYRPIISH